MNTNDSLYRKALARRPLNVQVRFGDTDAALFSGRDIFQAVKESGAIVLAANAEQNKVALADPGGFRTVYRYRSVQDTLYYQFHMYLIPSLIEKATCKLSVLFRNFLQERLACDALIYTENIKDRCSDVREAGPGTQVDALLQITSVYNYRNIFP